jgi:hypothetical protein
LIFQRQKRSDLMGESKKEALRVRFDSSVRLEFHGAKLSSDGGLLVYRELDQALGLTALAEEVLQDTRTGQNTQHTMTALIRQAIYGRLAIYEDASAAKARVEARLVVGKGGNCLKGNPKYCPEEGPWISFEFESGMKSLAFDQGRWENQLKDQEGRTIWLAKWEMSAEQRRPRSPQPHGRSLRVVLC